MPNRTADPLPKLDPALRDRVLTRLGFALPPAPDVTGLRALYLAWCRHVPFDNVRKLITLRTAPAGQPLPGMGAADFFTHWLAHGTGGTCWPTNHALHALTLSLGFAARPIGASMRDLGIINHGTLAVRIDGRDWLADTSALTDAPLPLGDKVYIHDDPVCAAEIEPVPPAHLLWFHTPPNPAYLPCRLLVDPFGTEQCRAAYEGSRERSPFNQRLYARRNRPGELLVLTGHTRCSKTATGLESRELAPDELRRALREEIGLSEPLVAEWERCGALAASFEPPAGPKPPPLTGVPPSQRQ
jgi:N-hydroxyarylamine O-acetyltransferase